MAVTRIKNNQITDSTITGSKFVTKTITGGLLSDNLTYGSNLTISGNLTVNGTTTTVDTTNTLIADPLLVLSRGETGTPSVDSGFIIERGTSANVGFIWDESADVFAAVTTSEDGSTAGNITISSYANVKAADLEGSSLSIDNIDIDGNTISSTDTNGNITITPNGTGDINLSADTVVVGDNNANATVTTNGTGDLILNTNSGTNSGSITIADGADGDITISPNGTGQVIASTAVISDLTSGRVVLAGTAGAIEDSANLTFNGSTLAVTGAVTISTTLGVTGESTLASATISDLTSGRVVLAGTSGAIEDSANLTFDGTVLTTTKVTVDNISIDGDTISSAHDTITIDPSTSGAGGTVVIAGNLQVTGTTTTIDSTVVTVADPVFQLGASGSDDNLDRGIKALYNNGGAKTAFFGRDDSTSEFIYINDATDTASVFSGSLGSAAFGSLRVSDLTDNRVLIGGTSGEIEDSANLTFDGTDLTVSSAIVSDLTSGRVVLAGTSGAIEDSGNLTFNGSTLAVTGAVTVSTTLGVTGESTLASATVSDLTSGRVVLAGTAGAIQDSANLTFNGTTLTVTGAAAIDNVTIDGNSITSSNALTLDAAASQSIVINEAGADVDVRIEASGQANAFFLEGSTGNIGLRTATPTANAIMTMNSTDSFIMPLGTTAQRPGTSVEGMTRYNSSLSQIEFYNGSEWKVAGAEFTIITADDFSGDGSTLQFTLSEDSTSAGLLVALNGVLQDPGTAYSVSGTTLTFTEAPAPGDNIDARIITTTTEVTTIADSNTSFVVNDTTETAITTINGNVVVTVTNAAVVPGANVTYDLGTSSLRWRDLYLSGNTIALGDLRLKDNGGGEFGIFQADGVTAATLSSDNVDTTVITNGTSNVSVASNSNVTVTVAGGTSGVFTSTGLVAEVTANNIQVGVTGNNEIDTSSGNLTIDSAGGTVTIDDNLIVSGDLTVNGTTTTINSTTLTVDDLNVVVASGAADAAAANGAGITVDGASATITYANTGDKWVFNKPVDTGSNNITTTGTVTGGTLTGTLNNTLTMATSGTGLSGSATFNNSGAASFTVTSNATNANTNSTIVARDGSGNFSAGTITANLTGTASLATEVTVTANNTADETVYLTFVDGATGSQGIETDTNLTYNPSTNVLSTTASQAQYADLAERYTADQEIEPGTVVCFGGTAEVTVCDHDADRRVAGVVSTAPAYLMNSNLEAEHTVALALQGRVPCKVVGPVAKGDMMVSAGNGAARAEAEPKMGSVIGKALENFDGESGVIEVLVGRM